MRVRVTILAIAAAALQAAEYAAPAGTRPVIRHADSPSIIPGGRIIAPLGHQLVTGPGAFGLALSPSGRTLVSSNIGPERFSLTVLERDKKSGWLIHNLVQHQSKESELQRQAERDVSDVEWRSVFMGVAFSGEKSAFVSEGNSGRVRLVDLGAGERRRIYDLNQDGYSDSFTGDLAFDPERGVLYVLDQANFRVTAIDTRKNRILSSARVGRLPFAIALSPDYKKAYVTNVGMFEYKPVPGASRKEARATGLPFPAFGFPSPEALAGAKRRTDAGEVDVPGLGDPNVQESNSVCVVDLSDPANLKIDAFVRTGRPFGAESAGGSSPSAVLAIGDRILISNAHQDSITIIDAKTNAIAGEIPIRMPGLDQLRGVMPLGMAYDATTGWALVAEAGINAVGVIDLKQMRVIAHLPVGWFPTRVIVDHDAVYVSNAKGQGTGPNIRAAIAANGSPEFVDVLRRGTISAFTMPVPSELPKHTGAVFTANGFVPTATAATGKAAYPPIQHVVLIVKENRTFDEVFGDITTAANGPVAGAPPLARFGRTGYVEGAGRLSLQHINVTPNHHEMAARWSFSDNFYADSEVSVDGHHWLVGNYPDAWTESTLMASYAHEKDFRLTAAAPGRLLFAESDSSVHPDEQEQAGTIWHHFERHGITFRNFGEGFELSGVSEAEGLKPTGARFLTNVPMPDSLYRNTSRQYPGFNMNIPDQFRADQFIKEIDEKYVNGREPLPQFIYIHLPNDHMDKERPADGYPYRGSFVADNDYALGRIVEYLSNSPWWREMAIFVTEDDAQGGRDHIDSHRTLLLEIGPYFKKNYVSHTHSSFPGLLKTIFGLLGVPPLNLFDACASELSDSFTNEADFEPYRLQGTDVRLFEPSKAREPLDPRPSPKMDGPQP